MTTPWLPHTRWSFSALMRIPAVLLNRDSAVVDLTADALDLLDDDLRLCNRRLVASDRDSNERLQALIRAAFDGDARRPQFTHTVVVRRQRRPLLVSLIGRQSYPESTTGSFTILASGQYRPSSRSGSDSPSRRFRADCVRGQAGRIHRNRRKPGGCSDEVWNSARYRGQKAQIHLREDRHAPPGRTRQPADQIRRSEPAHRAGRCDLSCRFHSRTSIAAQALCRPRLRGHRSEAERADESKRARCRVGQSTQAPSQRRCSIAVRAS